MRTNNCGWPWQLWHGTFGIWQPIGKDRASIQSLNGLQQNSFLMPGLCSCDHYTGPDKGANAATGGSFNQSGFFIHLYLFTLTCEGKMFAIHHSFHLLCLVWLLWPDINKLFHSIWHRPAREKKNEMVDVHHIPTCKINAPLCFYHYQEYL